MKFHTWKTYIIIKLIKKDVACIINIKIREREKRVWLDSTSILTVMLIVGRNKKRFQKEKNPWNRVTFGETLKILILNIALQNLWKYATKLRNVFFFY